ncbi:MAG TPA: UDP-N-acetylglucosamine--N-acetylmuramyl-(pentapeptide) pyrophosphoryl-undecaprenol N-acetylglucosamine transferase [Candidatus Baltobacteraceae bacterium]|nr:UDP-N-acetylglucosamine--N-acetylmuramyl-(pentapeptide) pyrophosphoryl-undecaprenol N-acetylglucosamine transferase [Candidatus Baltobacteraceae bacterium]
MKLLLTGGGTGGHVYPALAIAEALAGDGAFAPLDVLFVGTRDGFEARIVPKAGLPMAFVHAAPLLRKFSLAFARTLVANTAGFFEALGILHRFKPDVAIATGGYVAFPVIAALRLVRALRLSSARIALLEANAAPGLANRLLGPLVDEVWLTVAEPDRPLRKREVVTGTPVRASMLRPMAPERARLELGLDPQKTTIVVMGGSQGARSLNEAVAALIETRQVPGNWQLFWVSGERDFAALAARAREARSGSAVRLTGYLDDPRAAYAAADLVVARSGASTLGELAATGSPALLVPYPYATGDHQAHNAEVFRCAGAARVVADRDLDAASLWDELQAALEPQVLAAMRTAASRHGTDPRAAVLARVKQWLPAKNSIR